VFARARDRWRRTITGEIGAAARAHSRAHHLPRPLPYAGWGV